MRIIPLFIYGAALAWFSLTPIDQYGIDIWDKLAHFLVYAIFVVIASITADTQKRLVRFTCGIIVYGALLEIFQSFVPGRSMSALDGAANSVGALCAMLLVTWWRRVKTVYVSR